MKTELEKLKKSILEDGVIDASEVTKLREILYADDMIDRDEAELLFELNDATTGKDNASEWEKFFVASLVKYLLEDPDSPGEIDPAETAWLKKRISADGQIDKLEKALLVALKAKTKTFPAELASMLD